MDCRLERSAGFRAINALDDHGVVAHRAADKPPLARKGWRRALADNPKIAAAPTLPGGGGGEMTKRSKRVLDLDYLRIRSLIQGGTNLYASAIKWIDPDPGHDERAGEPLAVATRESSATCSVSKESPFGILPPDRDVGTHGNSSCAAGNLSLKIILVCIGANGAL